MEQSISGELRRQGKCSQQRRGGGATNEERRIQRPVFQVPRMGAQRQVLPQQRKRKKAKDGNIRMEEKETTQQEGKEVAQKGAKAKG